MFVFLLMKIVIVIQSYDSSTHGFGTGTSLHEGHQEIVTAGDSIKHLFGLFPCYACALCSDQQGDEPLDLK